MAAIAIEAKYRTPDPNTQIDLYEGLLRLSWDGNSIQGSGRLRFVWQPFPRLVFEFEMEIADIFNQSLQIDQDFKRVTVELLNAAGKGQGYVLGSTMNVGPSHFEKTLSGGIDGDFVLGNPCPTDTVLFHVPNFPKYLGESVTRSGGTWNGRLSFGSERFTIDLDEVGGNTALQRNLSASGGFAITHVGRMTRSDGAAIAFEDTTRLRWALRWWLSLVRSERTDPILLVGVHEGEEIWEIWERPVVAPLIARRTWLPVVLGSASGPGLTAMFRSLAGIHSKKVLAETIARAIDWYTQSVENAHQATTVILAQAGLELMSWLRLVEEGGLTEDGYKKLDASDALRLTLEFAGVELDVPAHVRDLYDAAERQMPKLDGPGAVVEIRNGTVHPKARARLSDDVVMEQGGDLAIRYLELLLLRRLGYLGPMFDRLKWGQPEPVPWDSDL